MSRFVDELTEQLAPRYTDLAQHRLYAHITSAAALRTFMAHHVFAVWDFMCLLKALHRQLVSVDAPWFPPKDALSAHLIGQLLAEEEGDICEDGVSYASHYELYLNAMRAIGAEVRPIQQLLVALREQATLPVALDRAGAPESATRFVLTTFRFFQRPVHELAAAFVYGREGITPTLFAPLIRQLKVGIDGLEPHQTRPLLYYFQRHIELDSGTHFPDALTMLANLVGDDRTKQHEAGTAARQALDARLAFFNAIADALPPTTSPNAGR